MQRDQSSSLVSQLNEARNEVSRVREELRRTELDLERERSKPQESTAVADRDKVRVCCSLW